MRLFIQLDIGQWQRQPYQKPLVSFASSLAADVIGTELDNQSESEIVGMVTKLCEQASKVFLFINATENVALGHTHRLVAFLAGNEEKLHTMVVRGENKFLKEVVAPIPGKVVYENEEEKLEQLIRAFAGGLSG